jgi:hypothetical protein
MTGLVNTRAAPTETGNNIIVSALQTEVQSSIARAVLDFITDNLSSSAPVNNDSGGSHEVKQAPTSENERVQDDKIPYNMLYYLYSSIYHDAKLYNYEHQGGADSTQSRKLVWKEDW